MANKSVQLVIDNNLCAGCGLCSALNSEKSKMEYNEEGFLRPTNVNTFSDEFDEKFEKFCPGFIIDHSILNKTEDSIWGNYNDIIFGYAKNDNVRHISSSGGILSALLIYLLEQKIVDGVIHIGVKKDNPLENEVKLSNTVEEVLRNAGSRYSPSAPLDRIDKYLDTDKTYVFVGKPCDVAALKMYSNVDCRVDERIKYMLSFFCAGVPSIEGSIKILEKNNLKKSDVAEFSYRGEGWPGYTRIKDKNGKVYKMKYEDSWGQILNRYLQKRCKICIDGIGEFADISCGDGWYGDEKGYPVFNEENGRSVILARSEKGQELFRNAVKAGYIKVEKTINSDDLKKIQPFQFDRRTTLISRISGMRLMLRMTPKYSKDIMLKSSSKASGRRLTAIFLGTVKRVLKGRL